MISGLRVDQGRTGKNCPGIAFIVERRDMGRSPLEKSRQHFQFYATTGHKLSFKVSIYISEFMFPLMDVRVSTPLYFVQHTTRAL